MSTMGKEASLDGLEFDGDTVLCRVCGDKASGFHYGVHACEGCKGFFRRSIQQKIQYRPCLKNQQCNIMRVNRNRCQYCRLKKCIAVGMSRDAVRFGRVPKKEKARIIEQMQKVNSQSHATQLASVLQNTPDLIQAVIAAHRQTCTFTLDHIKHMRDIALQKNDFVDCPAHMACPLNAHLAMDDNSPVWDDFSEFFTVAIKSVVDFAKSTPGFCLLSQDDQVTLLKAATFEVLLVRMACLFDPDTNTMLFTSGKLFKRVTSSVSTSAGFLLDSMFDFAERFNKLGLTDDELALFSAVVLLSPDRPGLRNIEQVEKIQNKLTESLQTVVNSNHADDNTLFAKILMKTTDLRTLNTLHSEKSIGPNSPCGGDSLVNDNSDSKMDMQQHRYGDSRSEGSSPSETSSISTLGSTLDSLSQDGAPIFPQRVSMDTSSHRQVVLNTPYGTFYREEPYGFYGLVSEQPTPRRRCHTLDRETMSRPRLHTIEEGNRRRYTLDRDYLNKMVNKLSDKLEKRAAIRGDSMPPSICSSAASSPIPEEYQAYLNSTREFIPISAADSTCSSRASPAINRDSLLPYASSPSSPNPRSRSGSIGAEDYNQQMRPRCYSFQMTSEGRASRAPVTVQHLSANRTLDRDRISQDDFQYQVMPEMRRGSVGASYGLHHRKKSLLVDRHPAYLSKSFSKVDNHHSSALTEPKKIGAGESAFESLSGIRIPVPTRAEQQQQQLAWNISSSAHTMSREQSIASSQIKQEKEAKNTPSSNFVSEEQPMSPMAVDDAPETTNVISNHASPSNSPPVEVFHKKFDKLRKHTIANTEKNEVEESEMVSVTPAENNTQNAPKKMEEKASENVKVTSDKPKLSAVDKHPQLLAHLKATNPTIQYRPYFSGSRQVPGFVNPPPQGGGDKMKIEPQEQPKQINYTKCPMVNNTLNTENELTNGYVSNKNMMNGEQREQFHAATVSHLKDKLLRKYDSMENLNKIGQNHTTFNDSIPNKVPSPGNSDLNTVNPSQIPTYPIPSMLTASAMTGVNVNQIPGSVLPAGMYQPAMPLHPAFVRATYSSVQNLNTLPTAAYNQPLASMQQMAQFYGTAGPGQFPQKKPESEGQPLNLCRPPTTNGTTLHHHEAGFLSFEQILDQKIKEEISS